MNEPWELPSQWRWAQWKSVAKVASHLVPPQSYPALPHIAPNHIESQTGRLLPYRTVHEDGVTSSKHLFRPGQVLYSKIRPYLAKAVVVDFEGLCSADMYPVETDLEPKFLQWWMLTPEFTRRASGEQARTVLPKINKHALGQLPVPVPPKQEQRRIVDILDDHLSRLDAADASSAKAAGGVRALLRATLLAGLRGDLVEDDPSEGTGGEAVDQVPAFERHAEDRVWPVPDSWVWARLGDLFEVNVGATPSRGAPELWSGDLPWVSSGEVAFNRIAKAREHIERSAAGNPATRIHPPGTVMLAMIGEGKTRGQAAILDVEAAHNQNCASIRVGATRVLPEYIYGYLEERYLETRRGGSGGQQPALNKGAIQRFPVPIPPVGTQRRLVQAWQGTRDTVGRLSLELDATRQRSAALRKSLLAAAFTGRLTDSLPPEPQSEGVSA